MLDTTTSTSPDHNWVALTQHRNVFFFMSIYIDAIIETPRKASKLSKVQKALIRIVGRIYRIIIVNISGAGGTDIFKEH